MLAVVPQRVQAQLQQKVQPPPLQRYAQCYSTLLNLAQPGTLLLSLNIQILLFISFQTTTTTTQAPKFVPLKQAELFSEGCGDSKSCFRIPSKCDFNCKVMVSYEKEGLDMVFKLVGYSDGYIAVGLSPDNDQMGEDLTTACYLNQGMY